MNRLSIKQKVKYICKNFLLTIGIKVFAKLMLDNCKKAYAINLLLNLAIKLLILYFTLNIQFDLIPFCFIENISDFQIW